MQFRIIIRTVCAVPKVKINIFLNFSNGAPTAAEWKIIFKIMLILAFEDWADGEWKV